MLFTNANLFIDGRFQRGAFRVENGRFAEITPDAAGDGIDLHGQYVIPGLVDIHNHGNSGADFSDGDYDGLVKMAKYLAANGVTSFAPASMTLPYDVLETAYKTAAALKKAAPGGCARLMGINMEGPFFSEKKKGAQNADYLRLPDYAAFERLYDASEGLLRVADIAAELPGAVEFTEKASKLCTVSIAHTDCTYEEATASPAPSARARSGKTSSQSSSVTDITSTPAPCEWRSSSSPAASASSRTRCAAAACRTDSIRSAGRTFS